MCPTAIKSGHMPFNLWCVPSVAHVEWKNSHYLIMKAWSCNALITVKSATFFFKKLEDPMYQRKNKKVLKLNKKKSNEWHIDQLCMSGFSAKNFNLFPITKHMKSKHIKFLTPIFVEWSYDNFKFSVFFPLSLNKLTIHDTT